MTILTVSRDIAAALAHRDRCERAGLCHICGESWNRAESPRCPSEREHPVSCSCDRPGAHRSICADVRGLRYDCGCRCHRGVRKGLPSPKTTTPAETIPSGRGT